VDFLVRFPRHERPRLENPKHVRKLLQTVERSDRKLVSFSRNVVGIASGEMPERKSTAEFIGEYGFLRLGEDLVCSFSDGNFSSSDRRPILVNLEEALLETRLEPLSQHELYQIVSHIVINASRSRHGCTIVIDLGPRPMEIAGQRLEEPIDLRHTHFLELTKSLAKVDGALHVGADLHLYGFPCPVKIVREGPGSTQRSGLRPSMSMLSSWSYPQTGPFPSFKGGWRFRHDVNGNPCQNPHQHRPRYKNGLNILALEPIMMGEVQIR
jgi:hypothetical protein